MKHKIVLIGTALSMALLSLLVMSQASLPLADSGLVSIKGGTFTMGSPASEASRSDNEVQHKVTLSPFLMGKYEVSQAEWVEVMGSNPSRLKEDKLPVENVSWYDILVYCNKRSLLEGRTPCYSIKRSTDPSKWGKVPGEYDDRSTWDSATCDFKADGYRLPTEAEWEYACRAGTTTATSFGKSLSSAQANFDGTNPYGGAAKGPDLGKTSPVGSYKANAWGLYDMHGNVWEWCWDWYGAYGTSTVTDPRGPGEGVYRVLRGGSWRYEGDYLRSAFRCDYKPYGRVNSLGFRVVCGR